MYPHIRFCIGVSTNQLLLEKEEILYPHLRLCAGSFEIILYCIKGRFPSIFCISVLRCRLQQQRRCTHNAQVSN